MSTQSTKYYHPQLHAEIQQTKIYRRTGGGSPKPMVQMSGTNQLVDLQKRTRSYRPSPPRKVVNIQLGMGGPPTKYNKSFGHYGEMAKRAGVSAQKLAPLIQNASRFSRIGGKLNPYLRAAEMIFDYAMWNAERKHIPVTPGWTPPTGGRWVCGSTGPDVIRGTYTTYASCGLAGQAFAETANMSRYSWIYGTRYAISPGNFRWLVQGIYSVASGGNGVYPVFQTAPAPFVPTIAPLPFWAAAARTQTITWPPFRRPPKVPPLAPKFRDIPPGPRVHERKGQLQEAMGKAVAVAFAATEFVDALEAVYDSLPDDVKRRTSKSGVARKGAMIGEGTRYSTPIDKFMAVYRNYQSINMSEMVKNLLINQLVDKIIGTMSAKGADKLRKQLGASGWGNII